MNLLAEGPATRAEEQDMSAEAKAIDTMTTDEMDEAAAQLFELAEIRRAQEHRPRRRLTNRRPARRSI